MDEKFTHDPGGSAPVDAELYNRVNKARARVEREELVLKFMMATNTLENPYGGPAESDVVLAVAIARTDKYLQWRNEERRK